MSSSNTVGAPYPKALGVDPHRRPPASFTSGLLAGLTVRVKLDEIQKADLGRKYARKDKRPLEPPPVVVGSFYNIINPGAANPHEQALDVDIAILGAICHIDLFPVPDGDERSVRSAQPEPTSAPQLATYPPAPLVSLPSPSSLFHHSVLPMPYTRGTADGLRPSCEALPPCHTLPTPSGYLRQAPTSMTYLQPGPVPTAPSDGPTLPGVRSLAHIGMQGPTDARQVPPPESDDSDIVAWYGSFAIREKTKCTGMLSGATFVQAEIVDYNGKREAMFVFSDLAVRMEGTFVLRYRLANVTSRCSSVPPHQILAECFGGSFKVYSTKEFPGLPPSTALTKLLSMYHIRVNLRENERKRRKRSEIESDAARQNTAAARAPRLMNSASFAGQDASSSARTDMYSPTASVASSSTSGGLTSRRYPRSATAREHERPRRGAHGVQGQMDWYLSSDEY